MPIKNNNFNIYNVSLKKKTPGDYFTPVNQKSRWYGLQFLRYRAWGTEFGNVRQKKDFFCPFTLTSQKIKILKDRIFCHFGSFFPFHPPDNPENQNFENLKKAILLSSYLYWIIVIFGEDVSFGGVFRCTMGLADKYGEMAIEFWIMECFVQNCYFHPSFIIPLYYSLFL